MRKSIIKLAAVLLMVLIFGQSTVLAKSRAKKSVAQGIDMIQQHIVYGEYYSAKKLSSIYKRKYPNEVFFESVHSRLSELDSTELFFF